MRRRLFVIVKTRNASGMGESLVRWSVACASDGKGGKLRFSVGVNQASQWWNDFQATVAFLCGLKVWIDIFCCFLCPMWLFLSCEMFLLSIFVRCDGYVLLLSVKIRLQERYCLCTMDIINATHILFRIGKSDVFSAKNAF